jgi:heme exporter protein D
MTPWGSLQAFVEMGGQGRFVWGAYGLSLALLALEAWSVHRRLRRARAAVRLLAQGEPE